MKISFSCQSCQARLQVDASRAGRAIRCPRCGQTTQIPKTENVSPPPTESVATDDANSSFAEICAFFEPNPFAFSFALDAEIPPSAAVNSNATTPNAAARRSLSDDSENSADQNAPQTFYREEFMRNRRKNVVPDEPAEFPASKSPSVNEMIAGLLEENER